METSTRLAQDLAGGLECLSISHGTLRRYDLFHAMFNALDTYRNENDVEADDLIGSIRHDVPAAAWNDDSHPYWWSLDDSYWIVNESLPDALSQLAPEGYYFGTSDGDGSDISFWPMPEDNI